MSPLYEKTFIIVALLLCSVSTVFAQSPPLIILGLRSAEGDDDLAGQLTSALRKKALEFKEWNATERAMSLDQMALAFDCEEVDADCLGKIAAGLKVSRIIYGTIRRSSMGANYDYIVALSFYDADSREIEGNILETLSTADCAPDAMEARSRDLLDKLSAATSKFGSITVRSNVQDAEVKFDEAVLGRMAGGSLVINNVEPGQHTVEIARDGYQSYRESTTVAKGQSNTIVGELSLISGPASAPASELPAAEPESRGGVPKWIPYALFGISGAALAGTIVSWAWISSINNDKDFKDYRSRVKAAKPGADMCDEAGAGNVYASPGTEQYKKFSDVKEMCSHGQTLTVLQWVFLGTALVAGGVGAYLLIARPGSADDQEAAQAEATVSPLLVQPRVGKGAVGLDALVRF